MVLASAGAAAVGTLDCGPQELGDPSGTVALWAFLGRFPRSALVQVVGSLVSKDSTAIVTFPRQIYHLLDEIWVMMLVKNANLSYYITLF